MEKERTLKTYRPLLLKKKEKYIYVTHIRYLKILSTLNFIDKLQFDF